MTHRLLRSQFASLKTWTWLLCIQTKEEKCCLVLKWEFSRSPEDPSKENNYIPPVASSHQRRDRVTQIQCRSKDQSPSKLFQQRSVLCPFFFFFLLFVISTSDHARGKDWIWRQSLCCNNSFVHYNILIFMHTSHFRLSFSVAYYQTRRNLMTDFVSRATIRRRDPYDFACQSK